MCIAMNGFTAGETITFGHYPQRGDGAEPEPVEWIVLDIDRNVVTLISKCALDAMPYSGNEPIVSWESCTLRKWLNSHFVDVAFNDDEWAMLFSVKVMAGVNPAFSTDPGNDTQDRVYLLSLEEAEWFFRSNEDRICAATAYAKARGAKTNRVDSCLWWLRSPGRQQDRAAYIMRGGAILRIGTSVLNDDLGVRPVIALRLT